MEKDNQQLTVSERYKLAISRYGKFLNNPTSLRPDSREYQHELHLINNEFQLILRLVNQLSLFSDNEEIEEVSTNYIPFLNVWYYIGDIHTRILNKDENSNNQGIDLDYKIENLKIAKDFIFIYLEQLNNYKILSSEQSKKFHILQKGQNYELGAMNKRFEKIENYKLEKELNKKLEILNHDNDNNSENELNKFDDEVIRLIYIDQLKLFTLKSFNMLESISMELQVLQNRPNSSSNPEQQQHQLEQDGKEDNRSRQYTKENDYGFTTKLENKPKLSYQVSDLINKQGKILQPFIITSQRDKLKEKVFGTGQVLPSMTVEEYLDYELANGKMMKDEVKDKPKDNEDEDELNEDEELEKRQWDDWKDENPKGAGNMKANIG